MYSCTDESKLIHLLEDLKPEELDQEQTEPMDIEMPQTPNTNQERKIGIIDDMILV